MDKFETLTLSVNESQESLMITPGMTSFQFNTLVPSASNYEVTGVSSDGQVCYVLNGFGQMVDHDINTVTLECTPNRYKVRVLVVGLTSEGLELSDKGDLLFVTQASTQLNGGWLLFNGSLETGSNYSVDIVNQPSGQVCSVDSGNGIVGTSDIISVTVTCH